MKRAARLCFLAVIASVLGSAHLKADVLAEYDPMGGNPNPNTQGWTWNGSGNIGGGGGTLLINGNPYALFTETVPTNVFLDPWSMTGRFRFAGNSQEEFGVMMFVDDGTNIWHLSFLNTGTDAVDGIYNGGDPNGPVLANTATKIWEEPVPAKPFDGFFDYAIVDADGAGGAVPQFYFQGAAVNPAVSLLPTPSMFPAGTIGFGGLNANEAGFMQIQHVAFDGNPNAVPEPSLMALAGTAALGLASWARRSRKR